MFLLIASLIRSIDSNIAWRSTINMQRCAAILAQMQLAFRFCVLLQIPLFCIGSDGVGVNLPFAHPTSQVPTGHPTTQAPTMHPTTQAPTEHPTTQAPIAHPTTQAPTELPTTPTQAREHRMSRKRRLDNCNLSLDQLRREHRAQEADAMPSSGAKAMPIGLRAKFARCPRPGHFIHDRRSRPRHQDSHHHHLHQVCKHCLTSELMNIGDGRRKTSMMKTLGGTATRRTVLMRAGDVRFQTLTRWAAKSIPCCQDQLLNDQLFHRRQSWTLRRPPIHRQKSGTRHRRRHSYHHRGHHRGHYFGRRRGSPIERPALRQKCRHQHDVRHRLAMPSGSNS